MEIKIPVRGAAVEKESRERERERESKLNNFSNLQKFFHGTGLCYWPKSF
jgi:hypothetical protein